MDIMRPSALHPYQPPLLSLVLSNLNLSLLVCYTAAVRAPGPDITSTLYYYIYYIVSMVICSIYEHGTAPQRYLVTYNYSQS